MELLNCMRFDFDEFCALMDEFCNMENSYGYYWDLDGSGKFFRKNNPDFTMIDLANYLNVNRIREIFYVEPYNGMIYVIIE